MTFEPIPQGVRNQYLATIVANIAAFSYGLGLGWASPNVPILLSSESPLDTGPVSIDQSAWISSLLCIGGAFGTFLYSLITDLLGRKWSVTSIGLPQVISWALIAFVPNIESLLVARFLIGFSAGGILVVIPVFVTEIANDSNRGALGNILGMFICSGTLFAFILGHCFVYSVLPTVAFGLSALFLFLMLWFPDTPHSLLLKNRPSDAERSLRFYKQLKCAEQSTACKLESCIDNPKSSQCTEDSVKMTVTELMVPPTRKGILLGMLLIAMTQFCGSFAIINYTATIFKNAGSNLHPNVCAMVIGLIQMLATFVLVSLVDRIGRKIILLISGACTALCHIVLGLYFFYQSNGYDMTALSWLPLICLSTLMFVVIGISTSSIVVAVELLPPKLRSSVPSAFFLSGWVMAFMFVRYFNAMVGAFAMHGCLWIFAGCCIFEFVIVAIWMPETKGKGYEEIRKALE